LPLDATDLPLGYSLGTGALTIEPPYRAGYAVEVGSDSPLSAHGTLIDGDGRPVSLMSGIATPRDRASPKIAVFTNSAGRFGIEGLSEGSWTIALDTASGHLLYTLLVVKGANALINAGTLSPSVTVEKHDAPPSRRPDVFAAAGRDE
jgi:outer membrane usher protein